MSEDLLRVMYAREWTVRYLGRFVYDATKSNTKH